jgi:hypothetical protein
LTPRPYYESDGVALYCGDWRAIVPAMPFETQNAIRAMVTDPPYGIGLRNGDVGGHRSDRWDTVAGDGDSNVATEALRFAEQVGIPAIAFASPDNPWPGECRNRIVWDKGGAVGGGGDIATCLKRSWELIQVFRNGPMIGPREESVWRFPIVPADTRLHICAKPVALMAKLISKFIPRGVTILDPFAGSGSTLVAAKETGNPAIGVELEERYCEIAADRLRQRVLF